METAKKIFIGMLPVAAGVLVGMTIHSIVWKKYLDAKI